MFYSQVILAKKGPLAKVWLAAHWGDKKLARPQIFATDIAQSVDTIVNPTMPLALRMSGHLLLGVVRIYSRKVKYVLSDCTEAMLKLQMAFDSSNVGGGGNGSGINNTGANTILLPGNGGKELLDSSGQPLSQPPPGTTNFGDYEQVHVVEGFCLPMPDQGEWIVAEEDEFENDGDGNGDGNNQYNQHQQERTSTGGMISLPLLNTTTQSPEARYQPPTEEAWVPFDPDNEDDEDEEDQVSDVELARAAGDSFLSGDETRRASSIIAKSPALLQGGTADKQGDDDEEEPADFAQVRLDSDDDDDDNNDNEQENKNKDHSNPHDTSLLQLSAGGADVSGLDTSGLGLSLGEEDDSSPTKMGTDAINNNNNNNNNKKRNSDEVTKKKATRKKRRKVIIDNDQTELSTEHIKAMLADTSDIVERMRHPADVDEDDDDEDLVRLHSGRKGTTNNNNNNMMSSFHVPTLTQPFLADDGRLHPELQQLWENAFYRALDKTCPFEKLESVDEMEEARNAPQNDEDDKSDDDEERSKTSMDPNALPPPLQDDEEEEPQDFVAPPMEDEEDEPMAPSVIEDSDSENGIEDLGLVNELQLSDDEDDDEEDREAVGEHTGTKWHKHTVKVLQLLQNRLRSEGDDTSKVNRDDDESDNEEKPTQLEFGDLAKNVNRRTAASCFIECLQLKTWDFVELQQDEEYGPITISAGTRFQEAPPNVA